jgi:formate dehydrogenase major subunit
MKDEISYQHTVCPYCTSGCGLYLVVKNGRIIGQEPMKSYPTNEGKMCIKGNNIYKLLYHPQRLQKPLVNGKECSWEKTLKLIAEKFKGISAEDFGILGSGKTSNEEGYVLQKFARVVLNTNNVEYCARFCHSATVGSRPCCGRRSYANLAVAYRPGGLHILSRCKRPGEFSRNCQAHTQSKK